MKRISRSKGGPIDTTRDHELTDWEAVDRFGVELARNLVRSAAEQPDPGARETVPPSR
jgi:menaquinone-dependent protoporphyrinogen oxidase